MELKQRTGSQRSDVRCLLIVPYGIETCKGEYCNKHISLLIVPYGIETSITVAIL